MSRHSAPTDYKPMVTGQPGMNGLEIIIYPPLFLVVFFILVVIFGDVVAVILTVIGYIGALLVTYHKQQVNRKARIAYNAR